MSELFDRRLRALRRDRAARSPADRLLLDRAFDECIDRLHDIPRRFTRALLIGAASPRWRVMLERMVDAVDVLDPGEAFARDSGGVVADEDRWIADAPQYDLVVAVGTLDTVNDVPRALANVRAAMVPDAALIGALAGGDSLPRLRAAMIEADRATGGVGARVHPRIAPSALAGLLTAAGFVMPVVDVDRVTFNYRSLGALVRDLRQMGATNVLAGQGPGRGRQWATYAEAAFLAQGHDGIVAERIDLLHFLAWSPARA